MVQDGLEDVYRAGRWDDAAHAAGILLRGNPQLERNSVFALMCAHAAIERSPEARPGVVASSGGTSEQTIAALISNRILDHCRGGDFVRAAALLQVISAVYPIIGATYREAINAARSDFSVAAPGAALASPILRREDGVDALVQQLVACGPQLRILIVMRRFWHTGSVRSHDVVDTLIASASAFGAAVFDIQPHWMVSWPDYLDQLRETIDAVAPHVIIYDDLFEATVPGPVRHKTGLMDQVAAVIADARRQYGSRVVNLYLDLWPATDEEAVLGLGAEIDLIADCHPSRRLPDCDPHGANRLSFPFPVVLPDPQVPVGVIPRAGFVGSCTFFNFSRAVWWAELGKSGLPFDFFETDHGKAAQFRSDRDYAALLASYQITLNFNRRTNGHHILVGRTLETLLVGGCLFEEDSADARCFLDPGQHYQPFRSLADLSATIPEYLADSERCRRLGLAGQEQVRRYFTGDHFWIGLLTRVGLL